MLIFDFKLWFELCQCSSCASWIRYSPTTTESAALKMASATQYINCRQCISGSLFSSPLTIDSNGLIIPNSPLPENTQTIDLENAIISPGFLELQINGALGFHFAHYGESATYKQALEN